MDVGTGTAMNSMDFGWILVFGDFLEITEIIQNQEAPSLDPIVESV